MGAYPPLEVPVLERVDLDEGEGVPLPVSVPPPPPPRLERKSCEEGVGRVENVEVSVEPPPPGMMVGPFPAPPSTRRNPREGVAPLVAVPPYPNP